MISSKKMRFVFLAAVLLAAVAGATPRQASAGFGSSPGAGHSRSLTAGITDGTSNTIVTPGSALLSRKAGGGAARVHTLASISAYTSIRAYTLPRVQHTLARTTPPPSL